MDRKQGDVMVDNTDGEPSTDERLTAAENAVAEMKSAVARLNWRTAALCAAIVFLGAFVGAYAWASLGSGESEPANRDVSATELLRPGVHCYDYPQERAVARQRALDAIDRMKWEDKWEAEHPPVGGYPIGAPGPVPVKFPMLRDTTAQGDSWDVARCFEIS